MQPEPRQPADRAAEPPPVGQLGDRVVATDRRHLALVVVAERLGRLARRGGAGSGGRRACRPGSPAGRPAAAARRRGPGDAAMSPMAKTSGWPGSDRSGSTTSRPPRAGRRAERRRQRPRPSRRSPRRSCRPRIVRAVRQVDPVRLDGRRRRRRGGPRRRGRTSVRRARSEDCGVNGASRRSPISTSTMRASRTGSCGKSLASTIRYSSRSPPAISTPVGPPPQTTTSSTPSATSDGSAAASSKRLRTWIRRAMASSTCFSGNVCSATPGTPKSLETAPLRRAPARRTATRSPSARSTRRAATSTRDDPRHPDRHVGAAPRAGRGRCRGWRRRRSRRRARPSPPGRAAAGTCGSCWRRAASRRRRRPAGRAAAARPPNPAPMTTTLGSAGRGGGCRTRCHTPTLGSPPWPSLESITRRSRSTASASSSSPRTTSTSSRRASPSASTSAGRPSAR